MKTMKWALLAVADRHQAVARRHGRLRLRFELRHTALQSLDLRLESAQIIGARSRCRNGHRRAGQKHPLRRFHVDPHFPNPALFAQPGKP